MDGTVAGVAQILEERAIGAGTVTRDGLQTMITTCLRDAGVMNILERLENPQVDPL